MSPGAAADNYAALVAAAVTEAEQGRAPAIPANAQWCVLTKILSDEDRKICPTWTLSKASFTGQVFSKENKNESSNSYKNIQELTA